MTVECKSCRRSLPHTSQFFQHWRTDGRCGLRTICRECTAAYASEHRCRCQFCGETRNLQHRDIYSGGVLVTVAECRIDCRTYDGPEWPVQLVTRSREERIAVRLSKVLPR